MVRWESPVPTLAARLATLRHLLLHLGFSLRKSVITS